MKRYIPILLFLAVYAAADAQQKNDDPLRREVVIEKEFTPIVRDASKINSIPELEVSASTHPGTRYADWDTPYNTGNALTPLSAGDNGAEAPDKQHGYARFVIGNYLNINANAGVRIVDTQKDRLLLWYGHNSCNAHLSFLDNEGGGKTWQRRNDNKLRLKYTHDFTKGRWNFDADYRYNTFNYYGMPLNDIPSRVSGSNQQTVQQYGFTTSFLSAPNKTFNYTIEAAYHGYNNDLGLYYGERGGIENHVTVAFDGNVAINDRHKAGIALSMDNLHYNRCQTHPIADDPALEGEKNTHTIIGLEPYFAIEKEALRFKAGVSIDFSFNYGTVFRIAPDVKFEWRFDKAGVLYTELTGGKSLNTWSRMSALTEYIDPTTILPDTYTPADFTLGFRSSILKKFHFALYGGIKYCVDALFDCRMEHLEVSATSTMATRSVIGFYSDDAYAWKVGAEMQYSLLDILTARLAWEHNEWRSDGARIRFSQPRDEWNVDVTVTPIKPLDIKAGFYYAGGLGYVNQSLENIPDETGTLPNIANLDLGATYRLNKMIHFSLQFNNLLSRKYDLFYGMPAQRFHFLAGMGIVF